MTVLIETMPPNEQQYEKVDTLKIYPQFIGGQAVGVGFEIDPNNSLSFCLYEKGFKFYFLSAQQDNPCVIQLIGTLWSTSADAHRLGRKGDGTLYSEIPNRFVSEQLAKIVVNEPIIVYAGMLPWGVLEFQLPSEVHITN